MRTLHIFAEDFGWVAVVVAEVEASVVRGVPCLAFVEAYDGFWEVYFLDGCFVAVFEED